MSDASRRLKTLMLLVDSSQRFADPVIRANVRDELAELSRLVRTTPLRRRRLLSVMHLARALESSLAAAIVSHGHPLPGGAPGMKNYLNALVNCAPPVLGQSLKDNCYDRVGRLRNKVAHSAGFYPTGDAQVNSALQSAEACLAIILR